MIVYEQLVEKLLSGFEVMEEDGPVVVKVTFKVGAVCKVHGNKNIRRSESPPAEGEDACDCVDAFVKHGLLLLYGDRCTVNGLHGD